MKFFRTALLINLKLCFTQKAFWVCLSLLILSLWGYTAMGQEQNILQIPVGICYDRSNPLLEQVFQDLPQDAGILFIYVEKFDEETVNQVATGELDCLYILNAAVRDRLISGDGAAKIEVIRSPRTTVDVLTNDMLFASILSQSAVEIASDRVAEIADIPYIEAYEALEAYAAPYQAADSAQSFVGAQAGYRDGTEQKAPVSGRIFHGIVLFGVLLCAAALIMGLIGDRNVLFSRLPLKPLLEYYASVWTTLLLGTGGAGFLGLLLCRLFQLPATNPAREAWAMLLYCAAIASLSLLLILLLPGSHSLSIGAPFLALLFLCFGELFFDWREISGLIDRFSSLLPTSGYLDILLHEALPGAVELSALLVGSLGASAVLLLFRSRRRGSST